MSTRLKILGALSAAGLLAPVMALAAAQPAAGYYATSGYTVSASGGNPCNLAGQAAGTSYSGIFYYPGPGKSGATFRQISNGKGGAGITLQKFPVTPAAGVTKFSGTIEQTTEGLPTPLSIPFTSTFTFLDASSFEAKLVATIAFSATSSCVVTDQLVFVKTGS